MTLHYLELLAAWDYARGKRYGYNRRHRPTPHYGIAGGNNER